MIFAKHYLPKGSPADELRACLKASYLCKHVKVFHLQTNMRVRLLKENSAFTNQLLEVGNGQVPVDVNTGTIKLPYTVELLSSLLLN